MSKVIRKGKINRHEKITQVLLSGKPVTPDEIAAVFKRSEEHTSELQSH